MVKLVQTLQKMKPTLNSEITLSDIAGSSGRANSSILGELSCG